MGRSVDYSSHGLEELLVDLALDSAPGRPAMASTAGPTFAPDELAGRKVIALFDRAAARDFVEDACVAPRPLRGCGEPSSVHRL